MISFVFALLIAHGVGHGLSEAFAIRAPHPGMAFAFYPVVVMLSIHTAGYTIKLPELSIANPWRYYVEYVSPARWAFELLMLSQFRYGYENAYDRSGVLSSFAFAHGTLAESARNLALGYAAVRVLVLLQLVGRVSQLRWLALAEYDALYFGGAAADEATALVAAAELDRAMAVGSEPVEATDEGSYPKPEGADTAGEDDGALIVANVCGGVIAASIDIPGRDAPAILDTASTADSADAADAALAATRIATNQAVCAPVELTVRDLGLVVDVPADDSGGGAPSPKTLLAGVSWAAAPGELVAVMGASGAGKSTMLSVIAGRFERVPGGAAALTGDVLFNGAPRAALPSSAVAFVAQEDVFLEAMTARETLAFAAAIKVADLADACAEFDDDGDGDDGAAAEGDDVERGGSGGSAQADCAGARHTSGVARTARVNDVLDALGLRERADTRVVALSGGQRRRLTIGLALVGRPSVLLLDEPTSGLAAPQAHALVARLRALATRWGATVATTIHPPSSATFALFSHALLLRRGGAVAYHGECAAAAAFFGVDGPGSPLAEGANPADVLLELLVADGAAPAPPWPPGAGAAWPPGAAGGPARPLASRLAPDACARVGDAILARSLPAPGMWHIACACVRRRLLLLHRPAPDNALRQLTMQNVFVAVFLSTVYWGQRSSRAHGALLYFATQFFCFSTIRGVHMLFVLRAVFSREYADAGARYVVGSWIANLVGELHFFALLGALFCGILWVTTGLGYFSEPDTFAYFLLSTFTTTIASAYTVQLCAALMAAEKQTVPLFILVSLFVAFFSGYPLLLSQMHPWWRWAAQSSYFRWSVQGLFKNQFTDHQEMDGVGILQLYSFNTHDKWTCHNFVIAIALAIGAAQLPILFLRARRGSG